MNLKKLFLNHCEDEQFEINKNQLNIINYLNDFNKSNFNQTFIKKFFKKKIINSVFI